MTRPFTIRSYPSGMSHVLFMGREFGRPYSDALVASQACDEWNEIAEDWRMKANAEAKEAKKK